MAKAVKRIDQNGKGLEKESTAVDGKSVPVASERGARRGTGYKA